MVACDEACAKEPNQPADILERTVAKAPDSLTPALRRDGVPNVERLRGAERELAARLDAIPDGASGAIADAFDRITDSVDTLAHLLRQHRASAPPRHASG